MKISMTHARHSAMFIACVMTLSGCATPIGPDIFSESRDTISSITVSVGEFAPGGLSSGGADPGKKAAQGAVVGAAPGAVGMAAIAPLCANPYTAGVCVVLMPVFGTMAVAGGGAGATHGESSGSMQAQAQQALAQVLPEDAAQRLLVAQVIEYGTTATKRIFNQTPKGKTDAPGGDADLEVAFLNAEGIPSQGGFFGIVSTDYAVSMQARARLKRSSDGVVLADRTYRYLSAPRPPKEWSSDEGRLLNTEIDKGYRQLAEWIIDDFFLMQPNDDQPIFPKPLEPPVKSCFANRPCTISIIGAAHAKTLRPTLRWSFSLNELRDGKVPDNETPGNLRYEVRVFQAREIRTQAGSTLWPIFLAYTRKGLASAEHALEEDLASCSYYIWTVRALFEQNTVTHATEWSGKYHSAYSPIRMRQAYTEPDAGMLSHGTPFNYGYPFSTPCDGKPMGEVKETIWEY
jgi:hypothetical protein